MKKRISILNILLIPLIIISLTFFGENNIYSSEKNNSNLLQSSSDSTKEDLSEVKAEIKKLKD